MNKWLWQVVLWIYRLQVLLQGIVLEALWGFEESNGYVVFDVSSDFPL